jgi:preprotein translocase subunit SecF
MRFPIRFLRTTPRVRFVAARYFSLAFTLLAFSATGYLLATKGLNFGIDFTGGVVMEVKTHTPADLTKMRSILKAPGIGDASLQQVDTDHQVMIRIRPEGDAAQNKVASHARALLDNGYGEPIDYLRVDYVGPQVGEELITGSAIALGLGMLAIMMYLWFRFEWQFGVGGILALLHDSILTVGFFAATQLEFNLTSVAALLTIIGYSINDSVVIYDRIRENMRKYKTLGIADLIDRSVNETLARTILTGGTVLLSLCALTVFGGEVLFGFSVAMLFGTIIGTYSSIYVSAILLYYIRPRHDDLTVT